MSVDPLEANNLYAPTHPELARLLEAVVQRLSEIPELPAKRLASARQELENARVYAVSVQRTGYHEVSG